MALSVLGPLRLTGPAGPVQVPGRKTREVLTLLALAAPRPLSVSALAHLLWDRPPPSAVKTVQGHVSHVRTALAAAHGDVRALLGGPAGYHLALTADQLDVLAVDQQRRRARISALSGDDHGAAQLLHGARQRWRGEPELPDTVGGEVERARLAEEYLQLVEDHLAALVAAGASADAIAELAALTTAHPLRERLWGLRMEALYRCGRQADALRAYQTVRRHLVAEIGIEPGHELRALEKAVLDHAVPNKAAPTTMTPPAVDISVDVPQYAEADGVHVAFGTYGDGPVDVLLLNPTFVPVDVLLEEPHVAGAIAGLAAGRRVIALNRRGTGLSDPVSPAEPPTIEQWVDDAVAVLDASRVERAHVLANADTSLVALLLAATRPDRIRSLTLVNGCARNTAAPDYPHGDASSTMSDVLREIRTRDAPPVVDVLSWIAPSVAGDPRFRTWWDAVGRRGASPRTAELLHRLIVEADVRHVLHLITAPVLLLSRLACASYDPCHGRYLADHLPSATLVEYADPDGPWFLGDVARVLKEFDVFTNRHGDLA